MSRPPGLPGSQFPGDDAQARKIRDLERQIQQLKAGLSGGGGGAPASDASIASAIANTNSLTRAELEEHFFPREGLALDGGTP